MTRHPGFCPACFAALDAEAQHCPRCGAVMAELSARDYREKLLRALHHPLAAVRMRVIIALSVRAEPETACALADCVLRHPTDVVEGLEVVRRLRDWPETEARDAALIRLSAHPSCLVRKAVERARAVPNNRRVPFSNGGSLNEGSPSP